VIPPEATTGFAVLRHGLRALGYTEGRDIVFEYRWSEAQGDRLSAVAADLVRLNVDVIVANGPITTIAAKQATSEIPIVMAISPADPVATGLVASLARPGGNVTGLGIFGPELSQKRLELVREMLPKVSRIGILWNPRTVHHPPLLRATEDAGRHLGVTLLRVEAGGAEDIERAFQAAVRGRAGALLALPSPEFFHIRARLAELGLKYRLSTLTHEPGFAKEGGLVQYGANLQENWRRAATYVDKILKGTKAGDLPVEQPTTFELIIHLKTAKALRLTIPPSLLLRADQVIE
jgi:ABC-type uncharacterized transport system substrate-binding protein